MRQRRMERRSKVADLSGPEAGKRGQAGGVAGDTWLAMG
jgi:hypothetical protein